MTKPLVFSYREHTELRDAYKQLLEDNQRLMADNRELRKKLSHKIDRNNELLMENSNLKVLLFRAYLILKPEVKSNVTSNN